MKIPVKLWPTPGMQVLNGTEADLESIKGRIERNIAKEMPRMAISPEGLAELIAQMEAAKLDAARYRWLRAVDNDYGRSLLATCGPDKLDKAIDAEIAKEAK